MSTPRAVVAIAASAGGIPALQRVLSDLRPDLQACVLVLQHRIARPRDPLPGILGRSCQLPVKSAEDGERLQEGMVYIAPADRHVHIEGDRLVLRDGSRIRYVLSSADPMFESLATSVG